MNSRDNVIQQIDDLFHPRSVAIVGAPRGMKSGAVFLIALLEQGFSGDIYPVNPRAETIGGLKSYASISDIPGAVDLAIVLVPHQHSLAVIKECAAKGVKGAVLFTAGYEETGTEAGRALQAEILSIARAAGMRLIGPNGMGLYSPQSGLSFFPRMSKTPGPVGIVSHSGSLTNILGVMASQKGILFSKVISSGNECDLSAADFLSYLGHDPDTGLVGAYIEGIRNGPRFLDALRDASHKKPVIIWKVGLTPEGSRAANSHTGALAGSRKIWQAVVKQSGAIPVVGFEAWVDALMGFSLLPEACGPRLVIISGPGGPAVSAAEACGNEGLILADLAEQTRSELSRFVPATGTSLQNPVDVSLTAHFDLEIFKASARTVAADPGVDAIVIIGSGLTPEDNQTFVDNMIQLQSECQKPFIMVKIPGFDPRFSQQFCEAGIPFFDSAERAIRTYGMVCGYRRWRALHT
jgi:acetyltransferase